MATGGSDVPSSTQAVYSEATRDDVDQMVDLNMEVEWDISVEKRCLYEDARNRKYETAIRTAFAFPMRELLLHSLGLEHSIFVKGVQDGRLVGYLDAVDVEDDLLTMPLRLIEDYPRGPHPGAILEKPVTKLDSIDCYTIRKWAKNQTLQTEHGNIGYEMMKSKRDSAPFYQIHMLAVASDKQRQGIGRGLLNYFQKLVGEKNMCLFAQRHNKGFYEKVGFQLLDSREAKSGAEILFFWKPGKST
ncbi:hypothetical protein DL764_008668 [Monosporascus ibericus]|uniref:N-acetyltransferase domain-containing protein n=1 Tax=Monosporascus ibericus TaxID=155417 RepID=A0A4V1X972_9PEZI|nr:hypothetical protein DL764_008668 [Monosporascus ibericus]